ncbi:MAG: DUF1206 domain-containing protein, partial [Acidimicrobiales bacterium]
MARLGFCARGLVYIVVGLIALQIAGGGGSPSGDEASKDGALREIVERSYGRPLLAVLAVGLAGYAVWRASEAAFGKRDEGDERKRTAKRAGSAAKAVLYGAFLVSTLKLIADPTPKRSGADEQESTATARLLEVSGGRLLVGAVGLAIIVGSGYVAYRGLAQKFNKRLDTSDMGRVEGKIIDVLGTVGMAARGLVFAVAGFLLVKAAIDFNPEQAKGLDGTLKVMAQRTYGQLLLTVTSIGIIA